MARTKGDNRAGHGGYTRQNSTFVVAWFYTFDDGVVQASVNNWETVHGNADFRTFAQPDAAFVGALVSGSTTKQLASPTGTWTATLKGYVVGVLGKDHREWSEVVKDGDWVAIVVVKNGVASLLMKGRVDNVGLNIHAGGNGEPDVSVTITGRDVAAPAEDTPVYWNPYDPLHASAIVGMPQILGPNARIAGRPDEVIPNLLLGLSGAAGTTFGHPPLVPAGVFGPDEVKWTDGILTSYVEKCRGLVFAPQILTTGSADSVWQFASQWLGPLNEMWIDTRSIDAGLRPGPAVITGTAPTSAFASATRDNGLLLRGSAHERAHSMGRGFLFMREKPFVNTADQGKSPWFSLPNHVVSYGSVRGLSLSRGRNRVNHIQVLGELPSSFGGDTMGLYAPVVDEGSIKRWGLRRLERRTPYMAELDEGGSIAFSSEYRRWTELVVSWNCLNAEYWTGMVHLGELMPDIKVGQKLTLIHGPPIGFGGTHGRTFPHDGGDPKKAMSFYVEAIQHTFNFGRTPQMETQIMVSRGYIEEKRAEDVLVAASYFTQQGRESTSSRNTLDGYDLLRETEDPDRGFA